MKLLSKFWISSWACSLISFSAMAQTCTPDTTVKNPGIYPSGNLIDTVWIGENYVETATYFSIKDTTITVTIDPYPTVSVNAAVDSVSVTNWSNSGGLNLPPGLSAGCNTAKCVFSGNSKNCFKISGLVSDIKDTGEYLITLNVNYYLKISSSPLNGVKYTLNSDIKPFTLIVKKRTVINKTHAFQPSQITIFPNPSNTGFSVSGIEDLNKVQLTISDVSGKLIFKEEYNPNTQNINFGNSLKPGIYFVILETPENTKSIVKIIKQ